MGQYWRTVNIDKREKIPSWDTKLGYYLFEDAPKTFHDTLYHPIRRTVFLPTSSLKNALPIRVNSLIGTATGILHLPNEEEVQEFADGLSWAGDRVICVGDYQEGDDLPPGLLNEEETAELADPESDAFDPNDGGTGLYSLNCHSVDTRLPSEILRDGFHNSFGLCVLRNLSRHIVVKLGHLALMRICWSSDPSVSMSGAGDIHRGQWAGDRFDIDNIVEEAAALWAAQNF
ncbi:hypothetical protein B0H17DRAFT_1098305 [Mycena rosella]|uniref:Uncharacterized protein n=1 Tax=Mycena rosella TaxID=1033263 RepID=A0AAD7CPJ4_MYCRO|nr:hypothetical protein B0H17DRAFT_1098305 [Mycena rosella]